MTAPADARRLGPSQRVRIAAITLAAAALFVVMRELPTGTNLSHMDFRVQGGNVIEFCDPANPQFLPVVAVRSPVTLTVAASGPARAGADVAATLSLTTFSGKPIAPEDLQVVQTKRIHLLIVGSRRSRTTSTCTRSRAGGLANGSSGSGRRFGGAYRFFADFTPVATNRGLYSEAEMAVDGRPQAPSPPGPRRSRGRPGWDGCVRALARLAPDPGRASPRTSGSPSRAVGGGPVPL